MDVHASAEKTRVKGHVARGMATAARPSSSAAHGDARRAMKIEQYEDLLNEKLRVELEALHDERDTLNERAAQFMQLRSNTQQLIEQRQTSLKTMVDVGSSFFMQAKVPDTSWIYVNVGLGFHAQLTLSEAADLCTKREAHYKTAASTLTEKIARKKAHIKLVAAALDEMTNHGYTSHTRTAFPID